MTAERFYEILKLIESVDQTLKLQQYLQAIRDSLTNLANAPAQPQQQANLGSAISSFTNAALKLPTAISPSEANVIKAMGGEEFFDPNILEKVTDSIQKNAMTPAVARDFVNDLATRRADFLSTVQSTAQGLNKLKLSTARLAVCGKSPLKSATFLTSARL